MKQKSILSSIIAFTLISTATFPVTKAYASDYEHYSLGKDHVNYLVVNSPKSLKIEGAQTVGNTLKAQLFKESGEKFSSSIKSTYRWYRLDKENSEGTIVGENETYALSESDIGKYIKVLVINNANTFESITGKIENKSSSVTLGVTKYGYWLKNADGTKLYFEDGKFVTGWKQIDGLYYRFDLNGIMQTGWQKDDSKMYYLDTNGVMVTGWKNIDGTSYYFYSTGSMRVINN